MALLTVSSRYLARREAMRPLRWVKRELWPPRGGAAVRARVPLLAAPEAVHVRMPADIAAPPELERRHLAALEHGRVWRARAREERAARRV